MTSSRNVLQLGVGAILVHDAYERQIGPGVEFGAKYDIGIAYATQAAAGATLIIGVLLSWQLGPHASWMLPAELLSLIALGANIVVDFALRATFMCGDDVLRALLYFLVMSPTALGHVAILMQPAMLYLGSLQHKDIHSYLLEAHAAQSMLLSEFYDQRDCMMWQLATMLTANAWLAPVLSRFAYIAEALAGGACAAVGAWATWLVVLSARGDSSGARIEEIARCQLRLRQLNARILAPALTAGDSRPGCC
jgi:hypothetical protein